MPVFKSRKRVIINNKVYHIYGTRDDDKTATAQVKKGNVFITIKDLKTKKMLFNFLQKKKVTKKATGKKNAGATKLKAIIAKAKTLKAMPKNKNRKWTELVKEAAKTL